MARPKVTLQPVANGYASATERIIEFNSGTVNGTGGLISILTREDGTVVVSLYRLDEGVTVNVSDEREAR